jgi:hypothetical protein
VSDRFSLSERAAARVARVFRRISYGDLLIAFVAASVTLFLVTRMGARAVVVFLAAAGLVGALSLVWLSRSLNALVGRLGDACDAWDLEEITRIRKLLDGGAPPSNDLDKNMRLVGLGEHLLREENYEEARRTFAAIERLALPAISRPGILSEQAYATALAGHPDHGVKLARDALDEAEAQEGYPDEKIAYLLARCGVALSLAGEHMEAMEMLIEARDRGLSEDWFTRAIYQYAQSARTYGKLEDAHAALTAVAELRGPFAERARAELESE